MKNKGKLICKASGVCTLLEDVGDGEYFRIAFVNEDDEVLAYKDISIPEALWMVKCIDQTISTLFDANIRSQWFGGSE
jgi:hypothetical protein